MAGLRRPRTAGIAFAIGVALVALSAIARADDLPRRGLLGVSTTDGTNGVTIVAVLPSLPGAAAGLQRDDIITAVDGTPVQTVAAFLQRLRRPAGTNVTLGIRRAGASLEARAALVEAPRETDPVVDTRYESVRVDGTLRRTLVTVPRGVSGKHPGVLIVGGIGCFSVDLATNTEDAYHRLTHDLSRRGIVTMRLEKSGVGDSQGPPCPTVDLDTEAASYAVALDALRNQPNVDPARLYVIGHSIGTIIGPRLALASPLAGLIALDGVARNWFEYELINSRRQEVLDGATPADVDRALALKEDCMHRMLVERRSRAEVLQAKPECKDYTQYPAPDAYLQQAAAVNFGELWMKQNEPVLAIYGDADFVTDEADHRRIVDIVNGVHPGSATLAVIPGMDHYLINAGSPKASLERLRRNEAAPYDRRLSETVLKWLCGRESCPPASG